MFGGRKGAGGGSVENEDAFGGRGGKMDVVDPDTSAGDDL